MGIEEDSQGLDPSEISVHMIVPFSDEVTVDVKVGVGDKAKLLVSLAVKVEGDAITADESRVLAYATDLITICTKS